MATFTGRPFLAGQTQGEAVVSHHSFNILASYMKSVLMRSKKAVCNDQDNPDLYRKVLSDKILCIPQTIGSTTAGLVIMNVVEMGIQPRALLFSKSIDSLAVAGVILSEIWMGERVITIDRLGDGFLDSVRDGMPITIKSDGSVVVAG